MPFSTKFWGKCSIFSLSDRGKFTLKTHDNSWSQLRTRMYSMHDSLSTPPSPKSTFSDDQTTNHGPESYFVPDLQATLNSYQGNIPILFTRIQYLVYRVCLYRSGASAKKLTWGHSNTVYLLMKNFRNPRARQPTNHYFEQRRATTKTGKNPSLSIEPWWKGPGLRLIARWSFFECAKFSRIFLK